LALIKPEPARRATLSNPPAKVLLWFNEALEPAFSSAWLEDSAKKRVSTDSAVVDKADPKLIQFKVPPLASGTYSVRYRVLSVDGHVIDYGYTFTVKPDGGH
jgi:methionine-rich copper-binding protein CopC